MTDLQSIFYIAGIIYVVLNIVVLLAIIIGMLLIIKAVKEARRKVEEKLRFAERIRQHPEEVIGAIGASLIRKSLHGIKNAFNKRKDNNSSE